MFVHIGTLGSTSNYMVWERVCNGRRSHPDLLYRTKTCGRWHIAILNASGNWFYFYSICLYYPFESRNALFAIDSRLWNQDCRVCTITLKPLHPNTPHGWAWSQASRWWTWCCIWCWMVLGNTLDHAAAHGSVAAASTDDLEALCWSIESLCCPRKV